MKSTSGKGLFYINPDPVWSSYQCLHSPMLAPTVARWRKRKSHQDTFWQRIAYDEKEQIFGGCTGPDIWSQFSDVVCFLCANTKKRIMKVRQKKSSRIPEWYSLSWVCEGEREAFCIHPPKKEEDRYWREEGVWGESRKVVEGRRGVWVGTHIIFDKRISKLKLDRSLRDLTIFWTILQVCPSMEVCEGWNSPGYKSV